jgi:glycosyltransferase involved in cell wall biosynthesis
MDRPVIVHISGDFPDCIAPNKTRAIANLVEATSEFDHIVYSLNRVPAWSRIESIQFSNNKIALAYGAPSKGFFLRSRMEALADWIVADLVARRRRIDVVHAHKLTIEGIAGRRVADAMKIPLVCSVQADTDAKIVWARPDLRAHFRHIWKTADYAVPFSPRGRDEMNSRLGQRTGRTSLLPCITHQDNLLPAKPVENSHFISIFHFGAHVRKNAKGLIGAIQLASREHPDIKLDIFGSGRPAELRAMDKLIGDADLRDRIQLRGPLRHELVQRQIQEYVAFVMPSRRETYGMVFAESLLAGVPILQSKGWGIHGLFPDADVGYSCDTNSIEDIKQGILYLHENEAKLKKRIARRQTAGGFDMLRRASVAAQYRNIIATVTSNSAVSSTHPVLAETAIPAQSPHV